jgi:chromosomal replication initiation ATPase DnaA
MLLESDTKKDVIDRASFSAIWSIIERTCKDQKVSVGLIVGQKRDQRFINTRALIAVRARSRKFSFQDIGAALGNRHWTTIMDLCGNDEERRFKK